jgi:outer membrane protein assembly factor BamB
MERLTLSIWKTKGEIQMIARRSGFMFQRLHTRRRGCNGLVFMTFVLMFSPFVLPTSSRATEDRWPNQGPTSAGLCVELATDSVEATVKRSRRHLVHRLDSSREGVRKWRERMADEGLLGKVSIEHWTSDRLPYADNLANLLVVGRSSEVPEEELRRVVAPGGMLIREGAEGDTTWVKPVPEETAEWRHQWNDAGGSVTNDDRAIGIPTGVQWVHGPLFAMAGRKSSTQSLVTSGGRNFYVTQNVSENLGQAMLPKRSQWLVARDSYNGLLLWKRPWTGPFVTGDGETNPRLVASPERLWLATEQGVMELDAVTGESIWEFPVAGEVTKLLRQARQESVENGKSDEDRLIVELDNGIVCLQEGELQWEFLDAGIHGTVATAEQVICLLSERSSDGSFQHHLACLHGETGELDWQTDLRPWTEARQLRIAFVHENGIAVQAHGSFYLFSRADGRHLWSRNTEALPGKAYVDERFVGHVQVGDLIWLLAENAPREPEGQKLWLGLDPETGKEVRQLRTTGAWPRTATPGKMGCQLILANEQYLIIPRQATFVDISTGEKHAFKFMRGGCGLGFVPANGLVYSHPHACGCFSEAIRGFIAAHSEPPPTEQDIGDAEERLFLASAKLPKRESRGGSKVSDDDWPMLRGGPERNAFSRGSLKEPRRTIWSSEVTKGSRNADHEEWRLRLGARISSPSIAGGTLYVADVQGQQLIALDTTNGTERWRFTVGARVSAPPTIDDGLCLFGAHDGYVYCLTADQGELIWRLRAAPMERRMMAFGQLESAWPVTGGVLVQDGIAFAAAGRAPDADGGIWVTAFDPRKGTVHWIRSLNERMEGLGEVLVGDGQYVYLANCRLDPRNGRVKVRAIGQLRGGKMGLMEGSWTQIDLALRKSMHDWTAQGASGQLLAFSDDEVTGFRLAESGAATLFSTSPKWNQKLPGTGQVHALAMTTKWLVVAGADRHDSQQGFLTLHDRKKGKVRHEVKLDGRPVFDGLAIAGGKVFVSLESGLVVCLGP